MGIHCPAEHGSKNNEPIKAQVSEKYKAQPLQRYNDIEVQRLDTVANPTMTFWERRLGARNKYLKKDLKKTQREVKTKNDTISGLREELRKLQQVNDSQAKALEKLRSDLDKMGREKQELSEAHNKQLYSLLTTYRE